MRWQLKAFAQAALSVLPMGDRAYYALQRYVTRSLPLSEDGFLEALEKARSHIACVAPHLGVPLSDASFFEFGAGYELVGPLTFYALGVRHQILIDVRQLVRADLVRDALARFHRVSLPEGMRAPRRPELTQGQLRETLEREFGIQYRAPHDARRTGLPAASFDCITSTGVLQHIPREDLRRILAECHRLLKPTGVVSFMVNYRDQYAAADARISIYNFLRFSDPAWRTFNSRLFYQNRLRHSDYLALYQEAGFQLVAEFTPEPSANELAVLRELRLADRFQPYGLAALATPGAHVVLRKRALGL